MDMTNPIHMKRGGAGVGVTLKHVHKVTSKGRTYIYAWRGGPRLKSDPETPEFLREYLDAIEKRRQKPSTETISGLLLEFEHSRAFAKLSSASRADYRRVIPAIAEAFGDAATAVFDDPRIKRDLRQWRDRFPGDRQADKALACFSRILSFAVQDGLLRTNPCHGIEPRYRREPQPRPWTDDEIARTCKHAPRAVAVAIRFMAESGLARADAAELAWSHVMAHHIEKRRAKTKVMARIPITAALHTVLDSVPHASSTVTVLTRPSGKPWTADALGKAIHAATKTAGVDATPHGLRATYACRLMSLGGTDEEIGEAMGWSLGTVRYVRRHYVDDATIFAGRIAKFSAKSGDGSGTKL